MLLARTLNAILLIALCQPVALGGEAVSIVTQAAARQPQLAIDATGGVHLVFGAESSLFYCRSTDGAKSFSQPVEVAHAKALSLGMRRGPRIAVAKDTVVVTAIAGEVGKGRDGDVLSWRSGDGGRTWQGPVRVNDVTASAREGLHAMAAAADGTLFCTWLDLRNNKSELFSSRSTDGGATWTANELVYRSPSGSVCECCHPSAAFDPQGRLYVMWRNSLEGARDMYVLASEDGGKTFGEAQKLGQGTWPLKACPMDGGMIAVGGKEPATVWRRDRQVYLASMTEPERLLGTGEQPWIAATKQGTSVVWLAKRPGDLLFVRPGKNQPTKLAGDARDPVLATRPDGQSPVVAAWETTQGGKSVILVQALATN
jgi:hypothetical protein